MASILIDELPLTDQDPNYKGWIGGVSCPSPYHDDNNPSASMNLEKGLVYCHACGVTSIVREYYDKLMEYEKKEVEKNILGDGNMAEAEPSPMPENKGGRRWQLPDWWFERGFTKEMADKYDIFCTNGFNICIPIRDINWEYAGYIIKQHDNVPKYLYGIGSKVGSNLFGFNFIEHNKRIIIVEGILDTIWLQCHGYPAVGMFGCTLSDEQVEIIDKHDFSEIYLMPDNDEVGRQIGLESMKEKLGNKVLNYYEIEYPEHYKDPQDIPGSDLSNIIQYAGGFNLYEPTGEKNGK